ncbi:unnamed protein product, partial [Mesorhabditis belari]|uniref:CDK5 regulatory subunit-associated protein 3 n=1 Tax=Mesorhabditis belari TaxID=2138241 RepID=A0AAF3FCW8_9BILA
MTENLPIDIHCAKLLDWLVSRRHCNKNWQKDVLVIREKIKHAILDMPESEEIVNLLTGAYINYFHCSKIIEILKGTEKDTRNFLGYYSSQRMKDWQEIDSLYKQENVYLAESAQILQRLVQYEVPGLKNQIKKAEQNLEESVKKEKEYMKQSADSKKLYGKELERFGLPGNKLRLELLELAKDLPTFFGEQSKKIANLKDAIEHYENFRTYLHKDAPPKTSLLPAMKLVSAKGDRATAFELKYGVEPTAVEPPNFELLLQANEKKENDDDGAIDFGDAEIAFDDDQVIDFGYDSNFEVVADDSGAVGSLVARGEDALGVLENTTTQKTLKNELQELLAFLTMRLEDEERDSQADALVLAAEVRPDNAKISNAQLNNWIRSVKEIVADFTNPQRIHLFKIKASPQYVETLVEDLERKRDAEGRLVDRAKLMQQKQSQHEQEEKKLRDNLKSLLESTKELQKEIESEISKKYSNRRVNIMGGINLIKTNTKKSLSVRGTLKCGAVPAFGVLTRLFDRGSEATQALTEEHTNKNGEFTLQASFNPVKNLSPELKVYHDCNDGKKPGLRKFRFRIPENYVVETGNNKIFELGLINLEMKMLGEGRTNNEKAEDHGRRLVRSVQEVVSCDECTIKDDVYISRDSESRRKITTKSPFRGLDESPEQRIDPW